MTAPDPRHKLLMIIGRYERGHMPKKANNWANSALFTVEGIFATMDDMEMNGVDVPTPGQVKALKTINLAACRWLRLEQADEDE